MKNENGVTIMALIITITIMILIVATVLYTASGIDTEVEDDVLIAELKTIHHIVLQEYNKKITLGNEYDYKGTVSTLEIFDNHSENLGITFEEKHDKYYTLIPDDLKALGAKNVSSEYLVCYETGEVANISYYKTSDGEPLYTK